MVATDPLQQIFRDATNLYAAAMERLVAVDMREAAEKAWCATKRATDRLILARSGTLPVATAQTSTCIRCMRQENAALEALRSRYAIIAHNLDGDCFYSGHCEPEEFMVELIGSVGFYIQEAYKQANERTP